MSEMIIDRNHKVIFLHNPKCGGTFVKSEYEKAGNRDTTLFFSTWVKQYNTDPWHITYDLLPRFIPNWEKYRLIVMVRNPYNRYLSARKELKRGLSSFPDKLRAPYLLEGEYRKMTKYQKYLRSLYDVTLRKDVKRFQHFLSIEDVQDSLELLESMNYYEQDLILRNRRVPWLMPQNFFVGTGVEILHFESEADWEKLAEILVLPDMLSRLVIPPDYKIRESSREMLRDLYFEDKWLFDFYDQKRL